MSDAPHPKEPAWTRVSLERFLDERDAKYQAQFAGLSAQLAAAEKAVQKAEQHAEAWRAQANEWRGAMSDREAQMMPRVEIEKQLLALGERITTLHSWASEGYGQRAAWSNLVGILALFVAVAAVVVAIVVK